MFRFDRLRALCAENKRSLRVLCELAGKNPGYIRNCETAPKDPDAASVSVWADFLGVSAAYLRGETDKKEKPSVLPEGLSKDEADLLYFFRTLSPEHQAMVLERCQTLAALNQKSD